MYKVYYNLGGELHMVSCGSGPEAGPYAWRIVMGYLEYGAWLEWEKKV